MTVISKIRDALICDKEDVESSIQSVDLKLWSWGVGVIAVLTIAGLFAFGLSVAGRFSQVDEHWRTHNKLATASNQALAQLRGSLGYGGFIHNFKNYVLRKEDNYKFKVENDIARINRNLNNFRALLTTDAERKALASIDSVLTQYARQFLLANRMIAAGRSVAEIDAAVKVDDKAALKAFHFLVNLTSKRSQSMEAQTGAELEEAIRFLSFGTLFAIAVLGFAALLILFIGKIIRANRRLQAAHDRINLLFDTAPDAMICVGVDGSVSKCNIQAEQLFGYQHEELIGMSIEQLMPEAFRASHEQLRTRYFREPRHRAMGTGFEFLALTKDGKQPVVEISLSHSGIEENALATIVVRDITQRKEVQKRLASAQRLEAVGQLTGGVAHDFNNLLAIIIGNADTLEEKVGNDGDALQSIEKIADAVERGSSLTNHLMAFSRQQALSPRTTDLSVLLNNVVEMFGRSLGERINLKLATSTDIWPVRIDSHQLENALLNLAINAKDAMPDGGAILIEAENVALPEARGTTSLDLPAGDYVQISVSDTGVGMAPDVLEKAFEPFFTTKGVGEGSGLGLSMVYGFAKQSNGHVSIDSTVGQGTTMKIYLPRSKDIVETKTNPCGTNDSNTGNERILVVEDDPEVRKISVSILTKQGYEIVGAGDGNEAVAKLKNGTKFDLLFTDIVLPGHLNGTEVAEAAKDIQPSIKVLFTSGYADSVVSERDIYSPHTHLLNKPFRRAQLLEKVRQVLDSPQNEPASH